MKIKVINPNTTQNMTDSIYEAACLYKRPETEILAVSPKIGPASIESFYEDSLSVIGVCEEVLKGDREENCDAYVLACFGDPGIFAAREITKKPVVGIAECAIATAKFLAPNFSIITCLDRTVRIAEEVVHRYGSGQFCKSVRSAGLGVLDFEVDFQRGLDTLAREARRAVEEDKAECVLLGCAGFVDFVESLRKDLGVPVLDGVSPAIKYAEILVEMGLETCKANTFAFPPEKDIKGFSDIINKGEFA
ncbi:aspartate/glutamate racemase family protein [Oscillospiraceae bacterium OttesenSCG-928-G22]|nr:aspartate/glutamate racemase family protein [Oscillospiraceae bacterium OttesenSCG-928-G22]